MERAFAGSGYGRRITGGEESLAVIDGRALLGHFEEWFVPDNMVQVVVGDIEADTVVARARALDEAAWQVRAQMEEAPERASGPRHGPSQVPWTPGHAVARGGVRRPHVVVGFPAPPVRDEDIPVLDVLCGLLGLGRSSRLRKSLQMERGLVSEVGASVVAHRDAGVIAVRAAATPGTLPSSVVEGVFHELARLKSDPVSGAEMRKSIRRLEASYLLEHETVEGAAMALGFFETMGDHAYAEEYVDRLAAVTPADIASAAGRYLSVEASASFTYMPDDDTYREDASAIEASARSGDGAPVPWRGSERPSGWSGHSSFVRPDIIHEAPRQAAERRVLSNGATLVARPSTRMPLVSIAFGFRGGFVEEPDDALGITGLTLKHALRGTRTRSAIELADVVEELGSGISTSVDRDGFGMGATVLARHFGDAVEALCDVLGRPALAEEEFEPVRAEAIAEVAGMEDDPFLRAMRRLVPLLFPAHPYGRPVTGTAGTLGSLRSGATAKWHQTTFSPDRLFVCVTGDVSYDAAAGELERGLADLPSGSARPGTGACALSPRGRADEPLERRGQSSVAVGFRGPPMGTRESAAMHVLGSAVSMMGGRLWRALRERPPHAYSVRAAPAAFRESGAVVGYVTTAPGGEEAAERTLVAELTELGRTGLTPEELERGKRYLAGMLEISMQRGSARAASYVVAEVAGVGYGHVDRLPAMVRDITREDVAAVAAEYLTAEDGPAVAILRG
jgi:zinc protease